MEEEFYYFFLTCLWSLTPINLHEIVQHYGGAKAFYQASDYSTLPKRTANTIIRIKQDPAVYQYWENYVRWSREDCMENTEALQMSDQRSVQLHERFIPCTSPDYPKELLQLPDYPYGIYIEGRLPGEYAGDETKASPRVAIVGARNCTTYGRELAYRFAKELAMNGCMVISGLASGIDGAAHQGCLDGNGYTLGILGSGIHTIYPRENYRLYRDMADRGGILSEYPPELKPLSHLFPRRNRLISMLADYVLVVEARKKSGSLITVDYALEQGKAVGAVPGRPCDDLSEGCNYLIRQGAACIVDTEDILEEFFDSIRLQDMKHEAMKVNLSLGLAPKEKKVYSVLRLEPQFLDDIIAALDLPVWETISILSELEVKGVIKQDPHQFYYRLY